jgi:hypothetical protein
MIWVAANLCIFKTVAHERPRKLINFLLATSILTYQLQVALWEELH